MHEATSVLFGLDGLRVVDVQRVDDNLLRVMVETIDRHGHCPDCGNVSSRVKQRPRVRIRDLPVSDSQVQLWWRKRRLVCANPQCGRGSFTQAMPQIPPRSRLTNRLRAKVASAIAASNRAVAEVAGEYRIAWHTAYRALIAAAARWLPEPQPTQVLGIDETRARSVRWILQAQRWRRSDPWMTSFVDADRQLVEQARAEGVELVGPDGVLGGLTKTVLETALQEEMSEHLGYETQVGQTHRILHPAQEPVIIHPRRRRGAALVAVTASDQFG